MNIPDFNQKNPHFTLKKKPNFNLIDFEKINALGKYHLVKKFSLQDKN